MVPVKEIHHKLPLSEWGINDRSYLIALNKSCHSQIHAKRGLVGREVVSQQRGNQNGNKSNKISGNGNYNIDCEVAVTYNKHETEEILLIGGDYYARCKCNDRSKYCGDS